MSNFTTAQYEQLLTTLRACNEVGVKSMILEPFKLRAATDNRAAVVVKTYDTPIFNSVAGAENSVITFGQVAGALERLQLGAQRSPSLTLRPMEGKDYYKMIEVSAKKLKFDVRLADPSIYADVIPSGTKGQVLYNMSFAPEDVKAIVDASRVFSPDNIWVHVAPSGVRVEMIDPAVGEKMSIQITDSADIDTTVGYKYATDVFIKLLNQKTDTKPNVDATLFGNGLLKINYKGLIDVHMLRRQGH